MMIMMEVMVMKILVGLEIIIIITKKLQAAIIGKAATKPKPYISNLT